MPIAAVPNYLQRAHTEFYLNTPPGHRFLLYFAAWGDNQETNKPDWRMKDRVPKIDKKTGQQKLGKSGMEWDDQPNDQYACTIAACKTPSFDAERSRRFKPGADPGLKPWQPMMNGLAIGTLPVNLAAEVCAHGGRYFNLSLDLPAEARGRELTANELEHYGALLEEFRVSKAP